MNITGVQPYSHGMREGTSVMLDQTYVCYTLLPGTGTKTMQLGSDDGWLRTQSRPLLYISPPSCVFHFSPHCPPPTLHSHSNAHPLLFVVLCLPGHVFRVSAGPNQNRQTLVSHIYMYPKKPPITLSCVLWCISSRRRRPRL